MKKGITRFYELLEKYISPQKPVFLIFIAFVLNILWIYFSYSNVNPSFSFSQLYYLKGDSIGYASMSESFYTQGCWCLEGIPTDYRMPGYLIMYLPFRIFFNQANTLNAIIIMQIVLSAISKFYLAKLAYNLFKSKPVFIITFLLYNLSNLVSSYNINLYTESFANSLIIFFIYTLYRYQKSQNYNQLLIASVLFLFIFTLRPFMGILLPLSFGLFLYIHKDHFKIFVLRFALFCVPLIAFEAVWIVRNYNHYNKFQPVETSINQGRASADNPYSLRLKLIKNFGGNEISWSSDTEGTWFTEEDFLQKNNINRPPDGVLPPTLFTNGLTLEKLKLGRKYDWLSQRAGISADSAQWYSNAAVDIYKEFIDTYRINNPYQYYIGARLKHFYYYVYQPFSDFKSAKYPVNVLLVFLNAFINVLVFCFGWAALIMLLFTWKDSFKLILCGIPFCLFVFFAFVFKGSESRSVLFSFAPFCIITAWGLTTLAIKYKTKGIAFLAVLFVICILVAFNYTIDAIKW